MLFDEPQFSMIQARFILVSRAWIMLFVIDGAI